jgi:hypothetical protein
MVPDYADPPFACPPEKRHGNFIDLTGKRFGRLVAVRFFGKVNGFNKWVCRCDCGRETNVGTGPLRGGKSKSCGCAKKQQPQNIRHGLAHKVPEYGVWTGMKKRCYNLQCEAYPDYGGRGITICERWNADFAAFYEDMGPRPSSRHTIERVDVDGNYCPENCVWLEAHLQVLNRRCSPKNRRSA